jgi:hypothetical protein
VVDSFCLGDAQNLDPKILSYLSGGYTFAPNTLDEAMAICEMESVLSFLERPDRTSDHTKHSRRNRFYKQHNYHNFHDASLEIKVERITQDSCPDRKQHAELGLSFVELGHSAK